MKKYDQLSNKEKHNFEEFLILTFEFSEDELAAIDKQKPMTMELFEYSVASEPFNPLQRAIHSER